MNKRELQEIGGEVTEELGKGFSLFRLAVKNIFTYFWLNAKICLTLACLSFLICLFTVYNAAVQDRNEQFARESASCNLYCCESSSLFKKFKETGVDIAYSDDIYVHSFNQLITNLYGVGGQWLGNSSYFVLKIDGEEYRPYENISFCTTASPQNNYFTAADYTELRARTGKTSFFVAGNYPAADDEIAVNETLLDAYRIEPEGLIGKEISVYIKDPREGKEPLLFQYTAKVAGIMTADLSRLTGHSADSNLRPAVLFRYENTFFRSATVVRHRAYLSKWPTVEQVDTWGFGSASPNTVYLGYIKLAQIQNLNNLQVLATNLYIIVGTALVIGLVLTIFLVIDKYMKVFSRSGGILLSFGMRRSQLYGLLVLQLLLLCIVSVPISFALTFVGYFAINAVVKWATDVMLTLSLRRIAGTLLFGVITVVALSLFFFTYAVLKLRRHTVRQFLATEVN